MSGPDLIRIQPPFCMAIYNFRTVHAPEARTFDPEHGCELLLVRRDRDNVSAFELILPGKTVAFAAECAIITPSSDRPEGLNELAYTVFVTESFRSMPDWREVQDAIHSALTAYGYSHGRGPSRTVAISFR